MTFIYVLAFTSNLLIKSCFHFHLKYSVSVFKESGLQNSVFLKTFLYFSSVVHISNYKLFCLNRLFGIKFEINIFLKVRKDVVPYWTYYYFFCILKMKTEDMFNFVLFSSYLD